MDVLAVVVVVVVGVGAGAAGAGFATGALLLELLLTNVLASVSALAAHDVLCSTESRAWAQQNQKHQRSSV